MVTMYKSDNITHNFILYKQHGHLSFSPHSLQLNSSLDSCIPDERLTKVSDLRRASRMKRPSLALLAFKLDFSCFICLIFIQCIQISSFPWAPRAHPFTLHTVELRGFVATE